MKKLLLLPLLFLPVIVAFVFEYNFCRFDILRYENLIEGILFGFILFGAISLMKISKARTILFVVAYVFFVISTWLETAFYYLYEANFNLSAIFVLLETNLQETGSFISETMDAPLLVFTLVMFLPLVFIIQFITRQVRFFSWFLNPPGIINRILIAAIGVIGLFTVMKLTGLINQNLPYLLAKTSVQYAFQSGEHDAFGLGDKVGAFKNSIRKRFDENETYVIVMGDSHTRNKMSLYGYERPTNPKLESIKDELVIFDDVISPSTIANKSLERALTLANYEDSTATGKGSLIQLFNSVGFKSFWISNQRPLGDEENMLARIASASDEVIHINITSAELSTPYDESLFPPLETALSDPYPKKVIFLHLLGNSQEYNKRYPEQFRLFKTLDDKNQDIEDIIDSYDNATIYNDYILNQVIDRVKKQDISSFVLYFSDHGEEVYETQDYYGHSEDYASKHMYDIPFILWQSEKFKEYRPIRFRPYRKYMLDDLFHSIGHLTNIKYDAYEPQRSVFSIYFRDRNRYILGDVDYDKLFDQ